MPGLVNKTVGFRVAVSEMEDEGKGVGLSKSGFCIEGTLRMKKDSDLTLPESEAYICTSA